MRWLFDKSIVRVFIECRDALKVDIKSIFWPLEVSLPLFEAGNWKCYTSICYNLDLTSGVFDKKKFGPYSILAEGSSMEIWHSHWWSKTGKTLENELHKSLFQTALEWPSISKPPSVDATLLQRQNMTVSFFNKGQFRMYLQSNFGFYVISNKVLCLF